MVPTENREHSGFPDKQQAIKKLGSVVVATFRPPYALADRGSLQTWQNVIISLNQRRPDLCKSFAEISEQNAGNNVANVYITGEYIGMQLSDSINGQPFYDQMTQWNGDHRRIPEKFRDGQYGLVREVVLETAEFMHNGYAYANQQHADVWRNTSVENHKKSFFVALCIADNMFKRIVGNENAPVKPIDNQAGDIDELFQYNLERSPRQTRIHSLWDLMIRNVLYLYTPEEQEFEKHTSQSEFSPIALDAFQTAARLAHHEWITVQLTNPLRVAGNYDNSDIGKRTKVLVKELRDSIRQGLWDNLGANEQNLLSLYMKKKQITEPDQAREQIALAMQKPSQEVIPDDIFEQLIVETDPRIGPYANLSKKDKGNNIVAIASTYESIRKRYLGKCESPQDVVDMLSAIVRHGLVKERGTFDGSNEMIELLSTEQHAAWAANAFKRDGISPDREFQAKLYRDLPHYGMPGVQEDWQDEQQYDRKAVILSCVVLLATFAQQCEDNHVSVEIESDVQREIDKMKFERVVMDNVIYEE